MSPRPSRRSLPVLACPSPSRSRDLRLCYGRRKGRADPSLAPEVVAAHDMVLDVRDSCPRLTPSRWSWAKERVLKPPRPPAPRP